MSNISSRFERLTREDIASGEDIASEAMRLCRRAVSARLSGSVQSADVDSAVTDATLEALRIMRAESKTVAEAARMAAYRIARDVQKDAGREAAKSVPADLSTDDIVTRLYGVANAPRPDGITQTRIGDVLAEAMEALSDLDGRAADLLTLASYLDVRDDGKDWTKGTPNAEAMCNALGIPPTGRNTVKVKRECADALTALRALTARVLSHHARQARAVRPAWSEEAATLAMRVQRADMPRGGGRVAWAGPMESGAQEVKLAILAQGSDAVTTSARDVQGVTPGLAYGITRAGFATVKRAKGRYGAGCGTHFLTESAARDHDAKCDGMHGRFTVATGTEAAES